MTRAGLARHISQETDRTLHESSLRQWESGVVPSVSARQHFAAGAWGGTYNGVEGGDPQDYHTVLRRLERAIGSLSNQPGPEITMAWTRLSARRRHALNRAIEAEVADLEDAVRRGREEAAAELRRPTPVPDDDVGDPVRRGAAAQA